MGEGRGSSACCQKTTWEAEWMLAWPVRVEEPAGLSSLQLLEVFISGSVFPGHLPTPLHPLTRSLSDSPGLAWGFLADIMLTISPVMQTSSFFTAVPSGACLDRRPSSGLPCFWLIFGWLFADDGIRITDWEEMCS